MNKQKNLFQIILNIFSWIFLAVFIIILLFTATSNLNLLSNYKSLVVLSGSMEPSIMINDVILVAKAPNYQRNEVITFTDNDGGTTTHRIAEIKETADEPQFITKGDANQTEDMDSITEKQIMGKVILTIPRLGYFINFVRTSTGLIIFVIIPAVLIVIDEFIKIVETRRKRKNVP